MVEKYIEKARKLLVREPDDGTLFLTRFNLPFSHERMAELVRQLIEDASIGRSGSCHLVRHTMATLMLEGGADMSFIQRCSVMHRSLRPRSTRKSPIRKLKEVHELTHPDAKLKKNTDCRSSAETCTPAAELVHPLTPRHPRDRTLLASWTRVTAVAGACEKECDRAHGNVGATLVHRESFYLSSAR